MKTLQSSGSFGEKTFKTFLFLFFLAFALVILYPFLYVIAYSFNEGLDALKGGITIWPRAFTLDNYRNIFENSQLLRGLANSILRTVIGAGTSTILCGFLGYAFTKRSLVGYRFYITLLVIPMYFTAGIIPTFLVYRSLGLINNFLVYIIPNLVWAYNIIIMRTFMAELPPSLEESAFLDGAQEFTIFFKIVLPLSLPVFATITLFNAVWQWNSWFDTLLFATKDGLQTLVSILATMLLEAQSKANSMQASRRGSGITSETLRAAMTIITTLPIVLVYPFLQKYFVNGVLIGAVKG